MLKKVSTLETNERQAKSTREIDCYLECFFACKLLCQFDLSAGNLYSEEMTLEV